MQLFYSAYVTLSALKFWLYSSQKLFHILRPTMPFQKNVSGNKAENDSVGLKIFHALVTCPIFLTILVVTCHCT